MTRSFRTSVPAVPSLPKSGVREGGKGDRIQTKSEITQKVFRLTPEMYKHIEKKVGSLYVNESSTPVQVAYHLGIQHVLNIIRNDITLEE